MTIYPVTWLILVGMIGVVYIMSLVTGWIDASSGVWRRLGERYPPQPPASDAHHGNIGAWVSTRERLQRAWSRPGCLGIVGFIIFFPIMFPVLLFRRGSGRFEVRYALDADYLHLDLDGSIGRISRPMSLPLAALTHIGTQGGHFGEWAWFHIDDFVVGIPTAAVESELELRRMLSEPITAPDANAGELERT